ncbi:helix-turn-helix domain-containing protein [Aedoeadaptatus pacaensis]|uniref:helix-turn-helix domain-containing protein n=1 Tax=Aedoeadaptatus pacaensis TaxID=1776390 RepID=UPI000838644E|nr:helix-turn-helix transcriptional regulator [Peptoniphilus pacaensis]
MADLVKVGKRIKSLREHANLNQKTVGAYLSLDQSMIAKMEKGERRITSDVIEKLARLFCCSPDFIISGDPGGESCTMSFRAKDLTTEDLEALAVVNQIVLNQFEMDRIWEARRRG